MIFIVGPTCSGKTAVSINLAKKAGKSEIISADSRQVYKQLSVGTAKPRGSWQIINGKQVFLYEGIPHHLIDFLEPESFFSAGEFVELAGKTSVDIKKRKQTPLFVGGTGLYIDSFINGITEMPQRDAKVREELLELEKTCGRAYLHGELKKIDPESAEKTHPNNIHRVIRALEIYKITGKPISEIHKTEKLKKIKDKEKNILFGLKWDRAVLYARIDKRVEWMLANGMVEETKKLLGLGFNLENSPALKSLGYKHVIEFLENKITFEQMKALIQQETRNYAKRQLTWFNRNKNINWIECGDKNFEELSGLIWKKLLP